MVPTKKDCASPTNALKFSYEYCGNAKSKVNLNEITLDKMLGFKIPVPEIEARLVWAHFDGVWIHIFSAFFLAYSACLSASRSPSGIYLMFIGMVVYFIAGSVYQVPIVYLISMMFGFSVTYMVSVNQNANILGVATSPFVISIIALISAWFDAANGGWLVFGFVVFYLVSAVYYL